MIKVLGHFPQSFNHILLSFNKIPPWVFLPDNHRHSLIYSQYIGKDILGTTKKILLLILSIILGSVNILFRWQCVLLTTFSVPGLNGQCPSLARI
jgi:hypothetical protein